MTLTISKHMRIPYLVLLFTFALFLACIPVTYYCINNLIQQTIWYEGLIPRYNYSFPQIEGEVLCHVTNFTFHPKDDRVMIDIFARVILNSNVTNITKNIPFRNDTILSYDGEYYETCQPCNQTIVFQQMNALFYNGSLFPCRVNQRSGNTGNTFYNGSYEQSTNFQHFLRWEDAIPTMPEEDLTSYIVLGIVIITLVIGFVTVILVSIRVRKLYLRDKTIRTRLLENSSNFRMTRINDEDVANVAVSHPVSLSGVSVRSEP